MGYWRRAPGVLSLNRDRRPVTDLTPLPLVILPVDQGNHPGGRVIQMTTILGQARQDLELDRPNPRDQVVQQVALAAILPDLRDLCLVAQDPRHQGSIPPNLLGLGPDLPHPIAQVVLRAVLHPDRLPLFPSRHPLQTCSKRVPSGAVATLYQVGSSLVSWTPQPSLPGLPRS
ncbi:hypothetical protein PI125_g26044 [Phytophthora idaei]|nr:hypothetical protein PI125_g26044 [Phytophthora idaei]